MQNNLNYASTSNIREVIKFYNLGDKTFETDIVKFSIQDMSGAKLLPSRFYNMHMRRSSYENACSSIESVTGQSVAEF